MAEFDSFTRGYYEAIDKAARAAADESKSEKQRKAKDSPGYVLGSILEPIAPIVDIGLMAGGLPPVASGSVSGLKQLSGAAAGVEGADASKGASDLANVSSGYMKWKAAQDKKKLQEEFIKKALASKKSAPSMPGSGMTLDDLLGLF